MTVASCILGSMNLTVFEDLLDYTGQPQFLDELTVARSEFIERTGDLFESDPSFDRRMSLFLEWFILDRVGPSGVRPLESFRQLRTADALTETERSHLDSLAASRLTLMEFRSWRGGVGRFIDLLPRSRARIACPVAPLGLTAGDIIECRRYQVDGEHFVSDAMTYLPRDARRTVVKACKHANKSPEPIDHAGFVHKITFLANRGERYSHVAPREIFKALTA